MIDYAYTAGADEPRAWHDWLGLLRADLESEGWPEGEIRHELARQLNELRRGRLADIYPEHRELDELLTDVHSLARVARINGCREALELAAAVLERVMDEGTAAT